MSPPLGRLLERALREFRVLFQIRRGFVARQGDDIYASVLLEGRTR